MLLYNQHSLTFLTYTLPCITASGYLELQFEEPLAYSGMHVTCVLPVRWIYMQFERNKGDISHFLPPPAVDPDPSVWHNEGFRWPLHSPTTHSGCEEAEQSAAISCRFLAHRWQQSNSGPQKNGKLKTDVWSPDFHPFRLPSDLLSTQIPEQNYIKFLFFWLNPAWLEQFTFLNHLLLSIKAIYKV